MFLYRCFCSALLFFVSLLSFSQTQSLWSQVKRDSEESIGLGMMQYQSVIVGNEDLFYDQNRIKGKNSWAAPHSWLVRDFNNDGFASIVSKYIKEPLDDLYRNLLYEYGLLAQLNPIAQFNHKRLFLPGPRRHTNTEEKTTNPPKTLIPHNFKGRVLKENPDYLLIRVSLLNS